MMWGRAAANAKTLREIQTDYARTFDTPHGRRVLQDILLMWGFFGSKADGSVIEHRDAAIWILDRMGVNHIDNLQEMTDALLRIRRVAPQDETSERDEDEEDAVWEGKPVGS